MSDISKTGVKFSDRVGWQMPEEPFHLDLEEPLMLDLPPPKSHIRDNKSNKGNITSDIPHEIPPIYSTKEDQEAREWIEFMRPDVRIGNRDPRGIKRLIECNAMPERKPKVTQKQMIVDNKLVPYDTKWNRYAKYQQMLKHHEKLTREQIIDWAKMWPQLHRKEAGYNQLRNFEKNNKERKVQETNRKLDCMIYGIGNTIQEIRKQDLKIQEINLRARNDSILRRLQSKQSNLWHAETKH